MAPPSRGVGAGTAKTAGDSTSVSRSPAANEAGLAAALACVNEGKVPQWTTASPVGLVLFALATAAVLYFMTATYAGEILRDHRLSGTWQPAYDLRAVEGSCKRNNLVITFCSAKIASLAESDKAPVSSQFMMLFSGGGGEALVPVRSTADPSAVAIAYAAETKLTNRTVSWLVATGLFTAMLAGLVIALWRGRYKGGRAHRALLAGLSELQARAEAVSAARRATA